jgi:soluble lytic murein transglycosylase-like protein
MLVGVSSALMQSSALAADIYSLEPRSHGRVAQIWFASELPVDGLGTSDTTHPARPQAIAGLHAHPRALKYFARIDSRAKALGLDTALVMAIVHVESAFRPNSVSPKGALGLMQVMPATAALYGRWTTKQLLDPTTNLDVGMRHMRRLLDGRQDKPALALAEYNAGERAVARSGQRIPHFAETMLYVPMVLAYAEHYQRWIQRASYVKDESVQ